MNLKFCYKILQKLLIKFQLGKMKENVLGVDGGDGCMAK